MGGDVDQQQQAVPMEPISQRTMHDEESACIHQAHVDQARFKIDYFDRSAQAVETRALRLHAAAAADTQALAFDWSTTA